MINIDDLDINIFEKESQKYFKSHIEFDEARRKIIKKFDDVQACPGSGKTTIVVAKLIIMAKKWDKSYQGICVLSHTNVAKDEIVKRLDKHPDGAKLLKYPHFIGTIQEFVNKFLGLPYCRYMGWPINYIDDNRCVRYIEKNLTYPIIALREKSLYPPALSNLLYKYNSENQCFDINYPLPKNQSINSNTAVDFKSIKQRLINDEGGYFYSEMYEFACAYLDLLKDLPENLQNRFPYVFIDEMQDVNNMQDEILQRIFYNSSVFVQRFGDPDQAIYRDGQEGNQTFNRNTNLLAITTSHRFSKHIAKLVSPSSFNQLQISSANIDQYRHTIFLVNEQTRTLVIPEFARLCLEEKIPLLDFSIKAVGSIGKEIDGLNQLRIVNYLPSYQSYIAKLDFTQSSLIQSIYFIKDDFDLTNSYFTAYNNFLELFKELFVQIKHVLCLKDQSLISSKNDLEKYLQEIKKEKSFKAVLLVLLDTELNENVWQRFISIWCNLFKIKKRLSCFDYKESQENYIGLDNKYIETSNGQTIEIDVGTIHKVKGETHAATLLLETKKNRYTFENIMDLILGIEDKRPTQQNKISLLKESYVAMTRPKYLLCIACDKTIFFEVEASEERQRVLDDRLKKAEELGWSILDLTES